VYKSSDNFPTFIFYVIFHSLILRPLLVIGTFALNCIRLYTICSYLPTHLMLSPSRHAKLYQRVRPSKSCPLINFSFGGLSDDPKNPDKQTLSRDQNHKRLIISNIFEHHCHITRSYISVAAYQACRYRLTTSAIATCRYSRILCDILLSSVQHTCPIDTTSSSVIVT
jgi:hypothetical protein